MYKIANKAKLRALNLLKDLYDTTSAESGINVLRGGKATSTVKDHMDLSLPMHKRYGYDTPESLLDGWRTTKKQNSSLSGPIKTRAEESMRNYTSRGWRYNTRPSFSTFNAQRPQRHVRDAYKDFRNALSTPGRVQTDTAYASQLSDYVNKSINNNPQLQQLFRNLRLFDAKNKLAGKFGIHYKSNSPIQDGIDEYAQVPLFTNLKLQKEFKKFNQDPGLVGEVAPELFSYDYDGTGEIFLPVVQRYNANKPFGAMPYLHGPKASLRVADEIDAAADAVKREGGVLNNETIAQRVEKPLGTSVTMHYGEPYPADRRDTLAHTLMHDADNDYESVIRKGAEGNPTPEQQYVVDTPMTEWLFRRAGREDVLSRPGIDLYTGQGDLDSALFKGTGLRIPHKFYNDGNHSDFLDDAKGLGAKFEHIAPDHESALNASLKMRENMPKEELHVHLNLDWLPTWPKDTPLWLTPGAGTATGYALRQYPVSRGHHAFSKDLKWIPVDSKDIEDVLTHAGGPVSLDDVFSTLPEQLQTNIRNIIKNTAKAKQHLIDTLPEDDAAINEIANTLKSQVKSNRFPQQAMNLMQGKESLFGNFTQPSGFNDWRWALRSRLRD
jgi:hypothetical protein